MTGAHRAPRVPVPVYGAMMLLAFALAAFVVIAVEAFADGELWGVFPVIGAVVELLIVVGLGRGSRVAYIAALSIGALQVTAGLSIVAGREVTESAIQLAAGALLLGLLLGPASARRYFAPG